MTRESPSSTSQGAKSTVFRPERHGLMAESKGRLAEAKVRRPYSKAPIEIASIEFVPMSERERQQAIAILAELFASMLHEPADTGSVSARG